MLGAVEVVSRRPHFHSNCEVVVCRLRDGGRRRVFCKYGGEPLFSSHGLRGGVSYEAEIYRSVLRPLQADVPHFYGSREDGATGLTWLVLGYVAGERLCFEEDVVQAAGWIGHFHARSLELARETRARSYESGTFAGFARRTSEFAAPLTDRSWLGPLCEQFAAVANELDSEPRVFLHGEYTPRNIICRLGRVNPIDWESAATGPGELDLGSLLDGWSLWVVRIAARAYANARWPEGPPPGFDRRLELARLFTHMRWLGDNAEWTADVESSWRFPAMHEIGRHLGLI